MSLNSIYLAVGCSLADDPTLGLTDSGVVLIYVRSMWITDWQNLAELKGTTNSEKFGSAVAMSETGRILAVGAIGANLHGANTGAVTIFHGPTTHASTWVQVGPTIHGVAGDSWFGAEIGLSLNGKRFVSGASRNTNSNGVRAGHVRVFQHGGTLDAAGTWTQLGADIEGVAADDRFGASVSLSSDGYTVASSAPMNDGSANKAGHVRVFKYNSASNAWNQEGQDIEGTYRRDNFGESVSLSGDGRRIAVGAHQGDTIPFTSDDSRGYVRVFELICTPMCTWTMVGPTLYGDDEFDEFHVVQLSSDGTRLAVGAPNGKCTLCNNRRGYVKVFELGYFRRRRRTLLSSAVESLGTYRHLLNQQRLSIYDPDPKCTTVWKSPPPSLSPPSTSPPAAQTLTPPSWDLPPPNPPPAPRIVVAISNETLPAPPPNISPPPPPPDSSIPILKLIGPVEVVVPLNTDYVDSGATCVDNVDGSIAVPEPDGLSAVNTAYATLPDRPYILTYECIDRSLNRIQLQRRVHVSDSPCAAASIASGRLEEVCPSTNDVDDDDTQPTCSIFGVCVGLSFAVYPDAKNASIPAASILADAIPPRVLLIGMKEGSFMARTTDGTLVLQEEILQGQVYRDPGYVCLDQTDGDISDRVSVFGESAVDSRNPTIDPFVIRYTCKDLAGVRAEEVQRWITVTSLCAGEATCDDGSCPLDGYCVVSKPTTVQLVHLPTEIVKDKPPTITLVGDERLEIEGSGYAKCVEGLAVSARCDRGVKAFDSTDGDLTPYVRACDRSFQDEGLAGCAISGSDYPGEYEIEFSVTDSAGQRARVVRKVVIVVQCEAGKVRCRDGVTCVPEGMPCEADIVTEIDEAVEFTAPPMPPNVTLLGSSILKIPRFIEYTSCSSGQFSSDLVPCDEGSLALGAMGESLADSLLVCPPESCMPFGCPGHELWRKGVHSCVNTSAPVGTAFSITFVAFSTEGLHASTTRTVMIDEPCPEGQHWCPANSPAGRCENAACSVVELLADDSSLPPSLRFDDTSSFAGPVVEWRTPPRDEMPFGFVYGQTPWNPSDIRGSAASPVAPCTGALVNEYFPQCAAMARDSSDAEKVTSTLLVNNPRDECAPGVLASGLCEPGVYRFFFSAVDNEGNVGEGDTAIEIEVLQGWQEMYRMYTRGNCSLLLDPRTPDSSRVRSSVSSLLALPTGRVRIHKCEQDPALGRRMDGLAAHLQVAVVRAYSDGGPLRPEQYGASRRSGSNRHPYAEGIDTDVLLDFAFHLAEVESADPNGLWAQSARVKAVSITADEFSNQMMVATNMTLEMIDGTADGDSATGSLSAVAGTLATFFDEGVDVSRTGHGGISASATEAFDLLAQTQAVTENATFVASSIASNTYQVQTRGDQLQATLQAAFTAVSETSGIAPNTPTECRGANGARHVYYSIGDSVPRLQNQGDEPSINSATNSTDKARRQLHSTVARRLLRAKSSSRSGVVARESLKAGNMPDESFAGYMQSELSTDDLRLVNHSGYNRPRTLGAVPRLRVVGGVLITQTRASRDAGCRGRQASNMVGQKSSVQWRFQELFPDALCSSEATAAFGYDPFYTRLDMPYDVAGLSSRYPSGLYDPALRTMRSAFYNTSELAAPDIPYAFFSRGYDGCVGKSSCEDFLDVDLESALFDVYLDGTLMEDRAHRLLSYLYLARFVDRQTTSVNIRVLLHNEQAQVLVDVRVRMDVNSHGEISATTAAWPIPLTDFLDGSVANSLLFTAEIVILVIAIVLCINSARSARKFASLFYDSVVLRLRQHIVRRRFVVDMWILIVEGLKISIPLFLLAGSCVQLSYYFTYVQGFTYEPSYRWYDGDGSATARPLLLKRDAPPQPPIEGYPRGAFRHTLPSDTSERDQYLQLLEKCDKMILLNGVYLGLQTPIFLGIAANVARLLMRIPGVYTFLHTTKRALPEMGLLVALMMMFTTLCAYALHLLIGDQFEPYARAKNAIAALAEYQIGDTSGLVYRNVMGVDRGRLMSASEIAGVAMVRIFFPIATAFLLMQFIVAVLLDYFSDEISRRSANARFAKQNETVHERVAMRAMTTNGILDSLRDHASALFYSIGWKNTSAYLFSRNSRWLHPGRGLRAFATNAGLTYAAESSDVMLAEEPSTPHARARAMEILESIVSNAGGDSEGVANEAHAIAASSMTAGNIRREGLQSDAARYLRMNVLNRRQELVVPILGLIGPVALGELLGRLHEFRSTATRSFSDILYDFTSRENRARLARSRVQQAVGDEIDRDACSRLAERITHDLGWRPGTEFDRSFGRALAMAVLKRARDTAKGMYAVSADMIVLSLTFEETVVQLRTSGLTPRGVGGLALLKRQLSNTATRPWKVVKTAWRSLFIGKSGVDKKGQDALETLRQNPQWSVMDLSVARAQKKRRRATKHQMMRDVVKMGGT